MHIHQLSGYIQSIYLVEYSDKLLLLDGCCRADVELLRQYIEQTLQRPFTDLKMVVVTHMHPDHAGAAHALRKLTGCKIVSANKDSHWYRGLSGKIMHLSDIALTYWVAGRLGKARKYLWYSPYLRADYQLVDGQQLPGFEDWQVFEMPGHTDRDLAVMHSDSKRIYVADLIVKVKRQFIPPFPVFHPNKYHRSLLRLKDLKPNSILLAHGGEVSLTEAQYDYLLHCAPETPKTHWRSSKMKLKKLFSRQ